MGVKALFKMWLWLMELCVLQKHTYSLQKAERDTTAPKVWTAGVAGRMVGEDLICPQNLGCEQIPQRATKVVFCSLAQHKWLILPVQKISVYLYPWLALDLFSAWTSLTSYWILPADAPWSGWQRNGAIQLKIKHNVMRWCVEGSHVGKNNPNLNCTQRRLHCNSCCHSGNRSWNQCGLAHWKTNIGAM